MPGHLQKKVTVSALVQEAPGRRPFHRKAAEHKRARREAEILRFVLSFLANHTNSLGLSKFPPGDDEARIFPPEYITCAAEADVIRRLRTTKT
jgi:hypothetical protein